MNNSLNLPLPKDYVAYQPGPYRLAMGLSPLDLAEWIEIDCHLPTDLAEKRRLLNQRREDVFAALPQADAASEETLALLADYLPTRYPQVYRQQHDGLTNLATGESWNLAAPPLHPLELVGRLVQEDLLIMGRDVATGAYRLTAACLCFPTRWRLAEKVGRSLLAIHAPVPGYKAHLGAPMDRLFERLNVEKPMWRLNWSVLDSPALFQPTAPPQPAGAPPITPENAGERLWLRMERQTLRRLPHSGDILFTVRIYTHPLAEVAAQPGRAARLASALRGLDDAMRLYKSSRNITDVAIAWLEAAATSATFA